VQRLFACPIYQVVGLVQDYEPDTAFLEEADKSIGQLGLTASAPHLISHSP
jgi:hypothetical protein